MTNELIAILLPLSSLLIIFGAYTQGRAWLISALVFINMAAYPNGALTFEAFGIPLNVAVAIYMPSFLATDLLAEHYGKKAAMEAIKVLLAVMAIIPVIMYLITLLDPNDFTSDLHGHICEIFKTSYRLSIAGIATLAFAQTFDVWFYDFIHNKSGNKHLWLRNCLSTTTSAFMDSMIFWSIAFHGILPNWFVLAMISYILKLCIALIDTPFVYLAKQITPQDKMAKLPTVP